MSREQEEGELLGQSSNNDQDGSAHVDLEQTNSEPPSEIVSACREGDLTTLKELLQQHENPNLKGLLIAVTKKLGETSQNLDYMGCFNLLLDLEQPQIDVREVDEHDSTALHYAVRNRNEEAIIKLLQKGAYIGARNKFDQIPMTGINPELLEKCFNKCIQTNSEKQGDKEYEIQINLSNLLPSDDESDEMALIKYIADSQDLQHLLCHPLIASFLLLKWRKISVLFYVISLVRIIFYISLLFFILFYNSLKNHQLFEGLRILMFSMGISTITQIVVYLFKGVMYLSICAELLLMGFWVSIVVPGSNEELQPSYAVTTILLACFQIYMKFGSLPFQGISTHVLMLKTVSKSFFWSCLQYSLFVVGFGLCFHIVLRKPENESNDHDINNFDGPWISIFKTFVMITGEYDSGNLNFSSLSSHWIFAIFVFMVIVLSNLINGSAVVDTQEIRAKAKLNASIRLTNILVTASKRIDVKDDHGKHMFIMTSSNKIVIYTTPQPETPQPTTPQPEIPQPTTPQSKRIVANFNSRLVNTFICIQKDDIRRYVYENAICNWGRKTTERLVDEISECFFAMEIKVVQAALAVIENNNQIKTQEKISMEREDRFKNIEKITLRQEAELKELKLSIETTMEKIVSLLQK